MKKIKKTQNVITTEEYIRINKMLSRQEEIDRYGKSINWCHTVTPKSIYSRKGKNKFSIRDIDY